MTNEGFTRGLVKAPANREASPVGYDSMESEDGVVLAEELLASLVNDCDEDVSGEFRDGSRNFDCFVEAEDGFDPYVLLNALNKTNRFEALRSATKNYLRSGLRQIS